MTTELTPQQHRVLVGLSNGRRQGQLASTLGLQESTVNAHARDIRRKLGAATNEQAIAIAFRKGLLS